MRTKHHSPQWFQMKIAHPIKIKPKVVPNVLLQLRKTLFPISYLWKQLLFINEQDSINETAASTWLKNISHIKLIKHSLFTVFRPDPTIFQFLLNAVTDIEALVQSGNDRMVYLNPSRHLTLRNSHLGSRESALLNCTNTVVHLSLWRHDQMRAW